MGMDLMLCTREGCKCKADRRGFCQKCLRIGMKDGSIPRRNAKAGDLVKFLRDQLSVETDACIPWPYGKLEPGYGMVTYDGQQMPSHRAMCILAHGEPPFDGAHAAHRCNNRACVNPGHIRWTTPKQNMADKVEHGTRQIGERNPMARFSEGEVLAIYRDDRSERELAKTLKCSASAVGNIKRGRTWGWLTEMSL